MKYSPTVFLGTECRSCSHILKPFSRIRWDQHEDLKKAGSVWQILEYRSPIVHSFMMMLLVSVYKTLLPSFSRLLYICKCGSGVVNMEINTLTLLGGTKHLFRCFYCSVASLSRRKVTLVTSYFWF